MFLLLFQAAQIGSCLKCPNRIKPSNTTTHKWKQMKRTMCFLNFYEPKKNRKQIELMQRIAKNLHQTYTLHEFILKTVSHVEDSEPIHNTGDHIEKPSTIFLGKSRPVMHILNLLEDTKQPSTTEKDLKQKTRFDNEINKSMQPRTKKNQPETIRNNSTPNCQSLRTTTLKRSLHLNQRRNTGKQIEPHLMKSQRAVKTCGTQNNPETTQNDKTHQTSPSHRKRPKTTQNDRMQRQKAKRTSERPKTTKKNEKQTTDNNYVKS